MLSIYTIKSANQAAHYYEQGDYYIKGDSIDNNVWFGKGATELGLTGAVDAAKFKLLLEGSLPNGVVLHNGYDKDGNPKHRPGYDLTFSACKSASILAIVGGDTRVTHAHISAVKAVLSKIENEMAGTRIKKNGAIEVVPTNNVAVAMFNHTDSRLLDPNMHTHCILLNVTKHEDRWRTLFGDDFYNYKMALGLEYRMHFAQNLMKLGYEIEQTTKNGLFEIANVPKDLIAHFSKRRIEIEKIIADSGRDASDKISITVNNGTKFEKIVNTTVSSMATLYSRAKKKTIHKDELQQHWTQQLHLAGYDKGALDNIINQSKNIGPIQPDNPGKILTDALPLALEHLTCNRHMFNDKDLTYAIKGLCLKSNVSDIQIQKQIQILKEQGDILLGNRGLLTTKIAKNIEQENINFVARAKDSCVTLLPMVASFFVKHLVKDEEKVTALTDILSSKARFLGIESSSEVQTHNLLKTLVKFTPHCTHYVLSKNYNAAKNVAGDIGVMKAFSIHDFISYTNKLIADKNIVKNLSTIWIINRSQQLLHKEIHSLLHNAQNLGAKILLTGDSFESTTFQQGNAFKQLIDNKLPIITLKSNMLLASNLIKDAQINQALNTMEDNKQIFYITNSKQRFDAACAYTASQETGVLLVQNKAMVMEANNLIRKYKHTNSTLQGAALQTQVLAPISLSAQERTTIASFNIGDVIRFNSNIQNTAFKQGSYYTIINIDEKNDSIILNTNNLEMCLHFSASIGKRLSVYRTQTLEIQVGDRLIWTDYTPLKINTLGYSKGDSLVAVGIEDNNLQVLGKNGIKTLNLANNIAQHIDYAYAKIMSNSNVQNNINGAILIEPNSFPNVLAQDLYSALKSFTTQAIIFSPEKHELLHGLQANQRVDAAISAISLAIDSSLDAQPVKGENVNLNAKTAVDYGIAKLAEREAVFRARDLEYLAFSYDIRTPVKDLEQTITMLEADGTLIKVDKDNYVFKEIYDCELACLKIMERGVDKVQPIVAAQYQALKNIDANKMLTVGQIEAISTISTAVDRVTLIQGVAGSGKTTMLKEVKSIARNCGYELIGLAPTASAKLNLHLKSIGADFDENNPHTFIHSGIHSQTLTSFLLTSEQMLATNPETAKAAYPKNTILVLDEASLISVKAMKSLLEIVEKLDLRLVAIGDDRQLPAIEASRVFSLMLGTSNNVVNMNINTRLKTPESLEIMQLIYAANLNPNLLDKAFEKMQLNIVEIPNKIERLQLMANYFTSMPGNRRNDILPMMPENKDRVMFNDLVRENLKKDGTLTGLALNTRVMVAKDLTITEKNYALSFEVGDFIRFNSNISRLNIKAGSYYQVLDANREQLILSNDDGVKTSWNPFRHARGNVEVYKQETRDIMVGDVIRWRRNFEDSGIINSETAKVLAIKNSVLSVRLANGKQHEFNVNMNCNQHFDHAYGSTVHVAQGLDKPNPIGLLDGPKPYQVESVAVSVGSVVVIPGDARENVSSKVGQVIASNINGEKCELTVIDREGHKQKLNSKFVEVYPDFNKTSYPPLANICNFLVQATRGDDFIVFVDNVEAYKASLKHSLEHLKQTALEMIDVQEGAKIKAKTAKMTSQVFGLAKPEELKNRLLSMSTTGQKTELGNNKKLNLNFEKPRSKLIKDGFYHQLDSLKQTINQDPLRFVSQILGPPVTKSSSYASFAMGRDKTRGNLTLDIVGHKAGIWCDHRTNEGGDLVSLYAKHYGLSYVEAAKKLFSERNIKEIDLSVIAKAQTANKSLSQKNEELARAKRIKIATQLYNSGVAISGTLAEKYLKNIRGIKRDIPDNFKFSPRCWHKELRTQKPALLIPAFDEHGKLQAVNRIYLGSTANKLNVMVKSPSDSQKLATQKAVLGPSTAATVFINKVAGSQVTYLTEGTENALSVKQSISNANISSCFGISQLKNVSLSSETKTVVICADNDGANVTTKKPLEQSIAKFLDNGFEVKLALPIGSNPSAKYDYNQMLIDRGVGAITASLSQAVVVKNISDLGCDKSPLYQSFSRLLELQFGKNIGSTTKAVEAEREF